MHERLEENDGKKEIMKFHWKTASVCRQLWKACTGEPDLNEDGSQTTFSTALSAFRILFPGSSH